ncbi:MAG: murein biosynthesis integral membrane protein MurJ [Myxococcales bacterium]|nr:murein biosynthesis integral membrane protein MurJ [Myxococcales bacterium]MCB9731281.1 murein biosynthesis integral membrane protein MurJ [Deltaproteobacteria bacterium]
MADEASAPAPPAPAPGKPPAERQHRSILRSASVMTLMTLVSRVLGLVREQVRAIYIGTGASSDAFGLASTIPNLFRRLVAEGAMTAAFVPVFTEYIKKGDEEELRVFLSRFFTVLTFAVVLLTVLGIVLSPWIIETFFAEEFRNVPGKVPLTIALTQLMWPYLTFVTVAAMLQAVLNSYRIFGPSAFTPVLLNLAIIIATIALSSAFADPAYALAVGFLVGGVLQVVFQIPYLRKHTPARFGLVRDFWGPGVRRVLKIMGPGVFAAGIYQIDVFVSQLIAAGLEGGSVSSLQYSLRLQELVLGVFVVSVAQVILPNLSDHTAEGDHEGVKSTIAYSTRLIGFVTLPATVVLFMIGPEIVRLLFQSGAFDAESTQKTAFALQFHGMGLLFIGQARVLQQVFFAYKDLKTPTLVAAFVAVLNIVLCYTLSVPLGHGGVALAGSLASAANTTIFITILERRLGGLGLPAILSRLGRMAVAAAVAGGVLWLLQTAWPSEHVARRLVLVVWVVVALGLAGGAYLAAASALRVNEFSGILGAIRRRFGRKK